MTADNDLSFREAGPADHAVTRQLVDEAFRPEDVVTFLDDLRADTCVLGEWVAEAAGEPVGHVAFSRVWVEQLGGTRVAAGILTPLAVRPGCSTHTRENAMWPTGSPAASATHSPSTQVSALRSSRNVTTFSGRKASSTSRRVTA